MSNYEYVLDDYVGDKRISLTHARVVWAGKRHHIGLADVLEDMCLTPHGLLVLVDLLFRNGLQYKRRLATEMVAPLTPGRNPGQKQLFVAVGLIVRGFQRCFGDRGKGARVREISMVDVMVGPVPVLHAARRNWAKMDQ